MKWSFDVHDVRVELTSRPMRWPDCTQVRHMPFHARIVRGLEGLLPVTVGLTPAPGTGAPSPWPPPARSVATGAMVLSRRSHDPQATVTHATTAPVMQVDWEASHPVLEALRIAFGPRASAAWPCIARPLSTVAKTLAPKLDEQTWKDMEARRPLETRFLSRMLTRLTTDGSSDYWLAKPENRKLYGRRLYEVLQGMNQEWFRQPGATATFTNDILGLAKRSLGMDESVLLHPLHPLLPEMRKLGLEVVEPFSQRDLAALHAARKGTDDMPGPFCLRVTVKWALCTAVDKPFRYRELSIESTWRKQKDYGHVNGLYRLMHGNRPPSQPGKVEMKFAQDWAQCFHDANRMKHDDAVVVAGPHPISGVEYLTQRRLCKGEVALLVFLYKDPYGAQGGHVLGFSGGTPSLLADSEYGEFSCRPPDPGLLMAQT